VSSLKITTVIWILILLYSHVHQTFGYPPNLPELISVFYNESE
jgi:hypothetical protein